MTIDFFHYCYGVIVDPELIDEKIEEQFLMLEIIVIPHNISQLDEDDCKGKVIFGKKEILVGEMNQKGLSFYQKIRRWAKNTTAVPVRNQACMGCYMAISDKVYSDIIKGEEIVTCPHCGRLLYLEPSDESMGA